MMMGKKEFVKRSKRRMLSLDIEPRSIRLYRNVKYLIEDMVKKDISHADFFTMIFEPVLLELASNRIKDNYNKDVKDTWVSFLSDDKTWSPLHRLEEISNGEMKTACGCGFPLKKQRREYKCPGEENICKKCVEAME
jgi:hypothetical protein